VGTDMHLAFTVDTCADVRTFHAAALAAGAREREGARRPDRVPP
jgi:hypothetical protein